MAELSTFLLLRGACAAGSWRRCGQTLEFPKFEFFVRRLRRQIVEQFSGLSPWNVLVRQILDDDDAPSTAWKRDDDLVSASDGTMRFAVLAVNVNPASFAGCLGLGPGLEQTGNIEPDVQANRLHLIHL